MLSKPEAQAGIYQNSLSEPLLTGSFAATRLNNSYFCELMVLFSLLCTLRSSLFHPLGVTSKSLAPKTASTSVSGRISSIRSQFHSWSIADHTFHYHSSFYCVSPTLALLPDPQVQPLCSWQAPSRYHPRAPKYVHSVYPTHRMSTDAHLSAVGWSV